MPTTRTITLNPTPWFLPPRVGGDNEFNGNGPRVSVSARLSIENSKKLVAHVYMHAKETKSDWTEAKGTAKYIMYTQQGDGRILRILSDTYSSHGYLDTDHEMDTFSKGSYELVNKFVCHGDVRGDDVGRRTGVQVFFNPVRIEVEESAAGVVSVTPNTTPFFIPNHINGDKDFGGHGPVIVVSVRVSVRNRNEIWADVRMNAKETRADWTEADGTANYVVYRHHRPIARILSDAYSRISMTDDSHGGSNIGLGGDDLVKNFYIVGDTSGDDAGVDTGVRVTFNRIRILEGNW